MSVIYIVLPLALVFVVLAVLVFLRQVHGGQYDDLDTPAVRMLHDDEPTLSPQDAGSAKSGKNQASPTPRTS